MKALLALLLAVALGVGLAATFVPDNAATVGGVGISQATLNGDLSAIANSPYRCVLQATGNIPSSLAAAGDSGATTGRHGGYSVTYARSWLGALIEDQLVADLAARRGLSASAADNAVALAGIKQTISATVSAKSATPTCKGSATTVLAALPAPLRQQIVTAAADRLVLALHAAGVSSAQTSLAAYYRNHPAKFINDVCITIVEFKTATATAAAQRAATLAIKLGKGTTTIATVVATVSAGTPTGATRVAAQTCAKTLFGKTQTLTAGAKKLFGAPLGKLVTETGTTQTTKTGKARKAYLFSVVTSQTPVRFTSQTVVNAIGRAYGTKVTGAAVKLLHTTPVSTDPRYGSFTDESFAPPLSPPATAVLRPTANLPPGAASGLLTAAKG